MIGNLKQANIEQRIWEFKQNRARQEEDLAISRRLYQGLIDRIARFNPAGRADENAG